MNIKTSTLTVILLLLFSFMALPMLINLTKANPIGMLPTAPEPLIIKFLSPKNSSNCLQDSLAITFSLQNPTLGGADSLTYMIDGSTKGDINGVITAKEGERFVGYFDFVNYSATLKLSDLTDGWHTLTINAKGTSPYDPSKGEMGSISDTLAEVYGSDSIQFLYDVAVPSVTVLIEENQNYTTSNVPLNFVLSEKTDWLAYSLDNQTQIMITGNTTLTDLSEGLHTLTVYANDTVGRKGNSQTITFNVIPETQETTANQADAKPFPTLLVVSTVVVIVVVAVASLIYFKKHKHRVESA